MMVSILLFLFVLVMYAKLLIWQALRFPDPDISDFELKRRVALGDGSATELARRKRVFMKLRALRRVVRPLLWVSIAGLAAVLGFLPWAIWSVLLLLTPIAARQKQLDIWAHALYAKFEGYIVKVADVSWPITRRWRPKAQSKSSAPQSREELLHIISHSVSVSDKEKDAIQARLDFQQKQIGDFTLPMVKVVTVAHDELLGPMLLDELHRTGQSVFPVMSGEVIVGLLHAEKVMSTKQTDSLKVAEAMDRTIYYVPKDAPADIIWQLSLQTKETMYLVVDNGETVGIVMFDTILRAMLGYKKKLKLSDFEDPRSVAASAATERE